MLVIFTAYVLRSELAELLSEAVHTLQRMPRIVDDLAVLFSGGPRCTFASPIAAYWIRQCARPASAATQLRYQAGIQPRLRLCAVSRFRIVVLRLLRSPIKSSGRSNVRTHSKYASHDAIGSEAQHSQGSLPQIGFVELGL